MHWCSRHGGINNALLLQKTHQRDQSIEAMRRITSLVNSPSALDEILHDALQEAGSLFQADAGSIFLFDESTGIMRAHLPSAFGVPGEETEQLSRFNIKPSAFGMTVAGSQHAFMFGDLARDRRVLPIYRPVVQKLSLASGMAVPLIVQGKGIGEIMFGAQKKDLFSKFAYS